MDLARINNFSIFPQQRTLATQPILYRKEQRTDPCIKSLVYRRRSIKLHRSYPLENRRNAKQERQDYIESVAHVVYEFVKT